MDHSLSQTRDGREEEAGDGCFPQLLRSLRRGDPRRAGLRPAAGHGALGWELPRVEGLGFRGLGFRVLGV